MTVVVHDKLRGVPNTASQAVGKGRILEWPQ